MQPSCVITKTERLTVRLLSEADILAVASIWADEQATRFMGGPRVFEEVRASLIYDLVTAAPKLNLWPVVEDSSGSVVGHCGLLPKTVEGRNEVELVYVIAPAFWGLGYATEAASAIRDHGFRVLGLSRLVSLIDPENAASERVAVKLGMRRQADTVRPSGKTMRVYGIEAESNPRPNERVSAEAS